MFSEMITIFFRFWGFSASSLAILRFAFAFCFYSSLDKAVLEKGSIWFSGRDFSTLLESDWGTNSEVLVDKSILSLRLFALGLCPLEELTVLCWLLILLSSFILCWIFIFIMSWREGWACWEGITESDFIVISGWLWTIVGSIGFNAAVFGHPWDCWEAKRFCWNCYRVNKGCWATGIRVLL